MSENISLLADLKVGKSCQLEAAAVIEQLEQQLAQRDATILAQQARIVYYRSQWPKHEPYHPNNDDLSALAAHDAEKDKTIAELEERSTDEEVLVLVQTIESLQGEKERLLICIRGFDDRIEVTDIKNAELEILNESLQAQVAQMREAFEIATRVSDTAGNLICSCCGHLYSPHLPYVHYENCTVKQALSATDYTWLAGHDKQVKQATLLAAADWFNKNNIHSCAANDIREISANLDK